MFDVFKQGKAVNKKAYSLSPVGRRNIEGASLAKNGILLNFITNNVTLFDGKNIDDYTPMLFQLSLMCLDLSLARNK